MAMELIQPQAEIWGKGGRYVRMINLPLSCA